MHLPVPYISQQQSATDPYWKERACAIAAIKMMGDFLVPGRLPSVDELIREGESIGGFTSHGWSHAHLVILLRNHGFPAYSQEFRTADPAALPAYQAGYYSDALLEHGVSKIIGEINSGRPAIVSVPGRQRLPGKTHMVLVIGYEGVTTNPHTLIVHDPDTNGLPGETRRIPVTNFRVEWRRFAIFTDLI
ncbi:MAG: hypothetical protein COV10_00515 [Candidatus Vogelbacteria bacterium CG10_big_fil_rev_8_21_14_0_10_51_16]|uniref:Peptidase C39-like domain-containing protein n=1 Tax=Candidatus Vogelbacteria bacterium CG10_big_fil_rev_8_21_14_0_10_51_16 TaxID=1975045 RepID=A0A2H0RFH0_9BACT|nr:MAG: hypothetical protein COV10_00515 [Candidatus Vogelbacteria bacterium CG10_big_fil_rev_8_21_14_0_10_51_16]